VVLSVVQKDSVDKARALVVRKVDSKAVAVTQVLLLVCKVAIRAVAEALALVTQAVAVAKVATLVVLPAAVKAVCNSTACLKVPVWN
jgi:hypothetical protein